MQLFIPYFRLLFWWFFFPLSLLSYIFNVDKEKERAHKENILQEMEESKKY